MWELWRFVGFAIRTFLGLIALALIAYGALWLFVKGTSLVPGRGNPDDALKRVQSYNNAIVTERNMRAAPTNTPDKCLLGQDPACSSRPGTGPTTP